MARNARSITVIHSGDLAASLALVACNTRSVLSLSDLPAAVLSAERFSGNVVALGCHFAALLDSQGVRGRLGAAMNPAREGVIVAGESAAWVWGVMREPPVTWQYAVRAKQRRYFSPDYPHTVRELELDEATDVVLREGRELTSRLRTLYDLLHLPEPRFTHDARVACRLLALHPSSTRERVLYELNRRPKHPSQRIAIERLARL